MYNFRRTTTTVYYLLLLILISFSFFNFSEQYFPLLNSDMAVNVLMTPGFSIPGDLYFWGQDRGGSLIPLLSQVLCSVYNFPPLLAVSVVHFLILVAGFAALSSLFKDLSLKLALAFIWFFPCWHFLDHLLLLYGVQMSLLGITIYFYNRFSKELHYKMKIVWLTVVWLSLITCVWVSDLAIFSMIPFILASMLNIKGGSRTLSLKGSFREKKTVPLLLVSAFWLAAGTAFILYAKSRAAVKIETYGHNFISSPEEVLSSLKVAGFSTLRVLGFATENVVESVFGWMILAGVPSLIILTRRKTDPSQRFTQQRWLVFFLLNGLTMLLIILLSHWVFLHGTGRRYFTVVYISLAMAILLYLQGNSPKNRPMRTTILFLLVLSGSLSSLSTFYFPERLNPRTEELTELKTLGNFGLIGNYRNAYVSASVDPNRIKATPNDKDNVRSKRCVAEVFNQPAIYLIKDEWMSSYPDTLLQFGHELVRQGRAFRLAGADLCRYRLVALHEVFTWKQMQVRGTVESDAGAENGQSVRMDPASDSKKHFVYGPFISLSPGKILVSFRLRSNENLSTGKLAFLDISADYGKTILASRSIRFCDFGRTDAFQEFEIPVELHRKYDGVEFRVLYLGGGQLSFDKVIVNGI